MKHKLLASAAAILLMTHGAAIAQQQHEKQKNEPAGHNAGASEAPKATQQPHAQQNPAHQPSQGASGTQHTNQSAAEKSRSQQGPTKSTVRQEHEQKAPTSKSAGRTTEPKHNAASTHERQNHKSSQKTTEQKSERRGTGHAYRPSENNNNAQAPAEDSNGRAQSEKRKAQNPSERRNARTPSNDRNRNAQSSAPAAGKGGRAQASTEQKTKLREAFVKERNLNRVQRTNITVRVGSRIPRSVHLAAIPAAIAAIVPAYRSYEYFEVNDRICIVEPATYEIVDVIEVGPAGPLPRSTIILSESDARGWAGRPIYSEDGQRVGVVVELMRGPDGHPGELRANVGSFLGIGERDVAIEPEMYRLGDDRVTIDIRADRVGTLRPIHAR